MAGMSFKAVIDFPKLFDPKGPPRVAMRAGPFPVCVGRRFTFSILRAILAADVSDGPS
jgi:hypothetical protein